MTSIQELAPDALRTAYGTFPSGVVALCGSMDGTPVGMAASTFVAVSLDPPLVAVCIQRSSRTWTLLRELPVLGVSVLGSDQHVAARRLAAREGDRFAGLSTTVSASGAVHLDGSPTQLSCSLESETDAGDHVIALLRVLGVAVDAEIEPLVFHRSAFGRVHR